MSKRTVRLTESELKKVISESIKRILKEESYFEFEDRSNYDEVKNWLNAMLKCFGATKSSARKILNMSGDDLLDNQFTTIHGVIIEYSVVDYGGHEMGIECDATCDNNCSVSDDMEGFIKASVDDSDGYFTLDMDYAPNPNFIRFKLMPFSRY